MSYRVVLIGGGAIAGHHLEALRLHPAFKAVAVADLSTERAEGLAAIYGLRAYGDYREMVEREKPDAAIIVLPHFLHREAAVFCAARGCHMLLEKPMALNVRECDEIIGASLAGGSRVMVGHTQHYLAINLAAKEVIDSGRLGTLAMIRDSRDFHYFSDARPDWFFEKAKAGGGILANLGAHSVDKIQWLGGGRIVKVKAAVSRYGTRGDVEGGGIALLENEHGLPAVLSQSGYPGAPKDETEFVFTGGILKLNPREGLRVSDGGDYREIPVAAGVDAFKLQLDDLLLYIRDGREPACSMAYSRSVVAVIEEIYRSADTGKEREVPSPAVQERPERERIG